MAKYIKKEIADLNGKGTTQAYYRLKTWRKLDSEEFAERCHSLHPSFSKGLISGVLDAVVDQLAYEISNGFSVKINGLGTFSAKLGVRKDKEMDSFEEGSKKLNAKSIEVTGISLRVDKKLIREIDRNCDLERGEEERLQTSKLTLEERIEKARQYLKKNGFMRVNDYAIPIPQPRASCADWPAIPRQASPVRDAEAANCTFCKLNSRIILWSYSPHAGCLS